MMRTAAACIAICFAASPAFAASYPVQGFWGVSDSADAQPIDCSSLRVIAFDGERRFDSGGGVPDFRAISSQDYGRDGWRIVEEFNTGQIVARNALTLRVRNPDQLELQLSPGGTLNLRRCK
jgi:hypothetical protein